MVEWVWDAYDTPYKETEKKKKQHMLRNREDSYRQ